jgi:heme A synthase
MSNRSISVAVAILSGTVIKSFDGACVIGGALRCGKKWDPHSAAVQREKSSLN